MLRHAHPADHLLLLAGEGELAPRQLARVDAHVAQCDTCRRRRARLQSALFGLSDSDAVAPTSTSPDLAVLRVRLQRALHERAAEPTGLWPRRVAHAVRTAAYPLAIAASLLAAALLLRSPGADQTRTMDRRGTALPLSAITPGAVSSLTADALCAGQRPSRTVPRDVRDRVLSDYGMHGVAPDAYELDALVTPELGGTVARANLWPQRYSATWSAHVKDALETLLARRVCEGRMSLATAQQALADDWIAAYKTHFRTDVPIAAHVASLEPDDELIIEGPSPIEATPVQFDGREPLHLRFVAAPAFEPRPLRQM